MKINLFPTCPIGQKNKASNKPVQKISERIIDNKICTISFLGAHQGLIKEDKKKL